MREVLGIIMPAPQGLVPLVLSALDVDTRSWFLVLHLPPWAQLPGALGPAVAGALPTVAGARAERGR